MKSPLQSSSLFTAAAAAAYGFEGRRFFPQQLTPPEESFDDENQLPTPEEFDKIVSDYLNNLSPKKRDKALVDQKRYQVIQQVLKDPRNTAISTAQFRFWVKKMFQLQPGTVGLVCHDGKPVAMKEQIYSILVQAHREAQHGGRDKTSALVRRKFSWIPKELVARFVRHCPFCITRRNGGQSPGVFTQQHKMHKPNQCINNNTPRHSFDASFLCTPSMYEDSDFSSTTENGYGASPTSYAYSSSTSPARRDSTSMYDKEEEDFLQAYARNGGFHPFITHPNATAAAAAAAVAAVASTSTTPFSTTSTTRTPNSGAPTLFDDHTSSPTSQNIFYQASTAAGYLGYPSYYYPNVLGIVPCDNTPTGIENHHHQPPPPVDSTVTTNSHPSTEDTTADILAHHHRHSQQQQQQQQQQPLPPTTPSNNTFMTYPNDDTNSNNHVLL